MAKNREARSVLEDVADSRFVGGSESMRVATVARIWSMTWSTSKQGMRSTAGNWVWLR